MKVLDKYVAKNFLIGYAVAFCVLIGLRIVIDLFVNLDEFTENADMGTLQVIRSIASFYGAHSLLYFRDFAGMIMMVAAAFSVGKMVRQHELVAVMASGVSLKRVMAPIIVLSLILTVAVVIDQEVLIPSLVNELVRDRDDMPDQDIYHLRFLRDDKNNLLFSRKFKIQDETFYRVTIITRQPAEDGKAWKCTGRIDAPKMTYNHQKKQWDLTNGRFTKFTPNPRGQRVIQMDSYKNDLKPEDVIIRNTAEYKNLLSWSQLQELAEKKGSVKDVVELSALMHFHVTEPAMSFVILMVGLPILICRDPKGMKSAIILSFGLTTACFLTAFVCKMFATENVFNIIMPQLWAWLPIFIFFPVAFLEVDSMKT